MNREELADLEGVRTRWRGTVQRFARKRKTNIPMALIENVTAVRLGGPPIGHVWIDCCDLDIAEGDLIYFNATVYSYRQGNTQWAWEPHNLPVKYGLKKPSNLLKAKVQ